jgi:hypothetical protein
MANPQQQPSHEESILTEKDFSILIHHVNARLEEHFDLLPDELVRRGLVVPAAIDWKDRLKMGGVMLAGTFAGVLAASYVAKRIGNNKAQVKEAETDKETARLRSVGGRQAIG